MIFLKRNKRSFPMQLLFKNLEIQYRTTLSQSFIRQIWIIERHFWTFSITHEICSIIHAHIRCRGGEGGPHTRAGQISRGGAWGFMESGLWETHFWPTLIAPIWDLKHFLKNIAYICWGGWQRWQKLCVCGFDNNVPHLSLVRSLKGLRMVSSVYHWLTLAIS